MLATGVRRPAAFIVFGCNPASFAIKLSSGGEVSRLRYFKIYLSAQTDCGHRESGLKSHFCSFYMPFIYFITCMLLNNIILMSFKYRNTYFYYVHLVGVAQGVGVSRKQPKLNPASTHECM